MWRDEAEVSQCSQAKSPRLVNSDEDEDIESDTQSTARPIDIGLVIKPGMSVKEVSTTVAALTRGEKYELLFKHVSPPPSTQSYGCKCKFNIEWLSKYQWLVYSPASDGVYCASCALLCSDHADKGFLVNVPFCNWVKLSDALSSHARHKYHTAPCKMQIYSEKPLIILTLGLM